MKRYNNLKNIDFYTEKYGDFSKRYAITCFLAFLGYSLVPRIVSYMIINVPAIHHLFLGIPIRYVYIFEQAVQCLFPFIIITAVFGKYILRSLKCYFGSSAAEFFEGFKRIFLIYFINQFAMLLATPIVMYFNQNKNANQQAVNAVTKTIPVTMIVAAVIAGPLIEEVIYRWGIFRPIYKYSPAAAHIISAGLFAFGHISNSFFSGNIYELANMLMYFIVGISLSMSYSITKNFSAPLLIHTLNNSVSMAVILIR